MRRRLQILIFIFPALAFLALFWLGPIAATVGISQMCIRDRHSTGKRFGADRRVPAPG